MIKLLRILPFMFLLSCEKQGPQGPQGNANVQSLTYQVTEWNFNNPAYYADISVPFVTADIISSGAVLVYAEVGTNIFSQVPLTFYLSDQYSTTIEVSHSIGKVRLFWVDSDLTQPLQPGAMNFKIVVIASALLQKHPDTDLSNYQEVKEQFQIN
jgi:hypothetical protein